MWKEPSAPVEVPDLDPLATTVAPWTGIAFVVSNLAGDRFCLGKCSLCEKYAKQ